MRRVTDPDSGRGLVAFLTGEYVIRLEACDAWLHCTQLPGDTVSSAVKVDPCQAVRIDCEPGLHVFLDLRKPAAYAHARQMLREWLGVDLTDSNEVVELAALGH